MFQKEYSSTKLLRRDFLCYNNIMKTKDKIFVGISGGVDSSVSLALLKNEGYNVTGVFLKVWSPDFLPCDWREERRSAMRVCATLGVPFLTLDCEAEYKKEVVDYMLKEYSEGRVPNPDVFCNKFVKFGVFLNKAKEMGADFIATGHYAESGKVDGKYELRESKDKDKDQSYFLYTLNQEQLSHSLFPVGGMIKSEVRSLAKKFGLPTAEKKDSQGLCFIGKVDMEDFLSHYIKKTPGDVLNLKGEVIGHHDGVVFYTIGQRHGFDITKKTPNDGRLFVIKKDIEKNTLTVADKEKDKKEVYSIKEIIVSDLHFISGNKPKLPLTTSVRIRYHQEKQEASVQESPKGYLIKFKNPQNAIAVGQSAVLYNQEICLGGGIISAIVQ
jgi:tRNA-specific 2-thiouridylase